MLDLAAGFAGHTEPGFGLVDEDTVVLLLEGGDDVQNGVHVVRRRRHGEAGGGAGVATDEEVLLIQRHVHPREHERYGGDHHRHAVARVEPAQRRHRCVPHPAAQLVPHRRVRRLHQPREHSACCGKGKRIN